jgi:LCP family protein required for cell wall assembly
VIALGVALVLTVGGVVGANVVIDAKLGDITRVELKLPPADPGKEGNFLLIGSDTRQFEDPSNASQAETFGDPSTQGGQRSDTIMVVHVEPESRKSFVVSFPRDLWVNIPGVGESKINAAFNDGPQKVVDTLKANFGVEVNHYLEVDFASFQAIVNAIGKVPVYVPAQARDDYTGFSVPAAGCYKLDGKTALEYVRTRYLEFYDTDTGTWKPASAIPDLGRIGRQQNFIRRIGSLAYRRALGNPLVANDLADSVIPKLRVDGNLSRSDIFKLVKTFRTVDPSDPSSVEMITLPTYGDKSSSGQDILRPDEPDAGQIIQRLKTFAVPPAPPKGILPAQVRVRVLNGSGQQGIAGTTLDTLQRQYGFAGAGLGNHARTPGTEVRYRPGVEKAAKLVLSYLGGRGKLVKDAKIADTDVVVVVGRDFKGIVAPPGVTPGATTATTAPPADGATPTTVAPDPQALAEAACVP